MFGNWRLLSWIFPDSQVSRLYRCQSAPVWCEPHRVSFDSTELQFDAGIVTAKAACIPTIDFQLIICFEVKQRDQHVILNKGNRVELNSRFHRCHKSQL